MEIDYDETEDVLFIRFSNDKIIMDISYGWNVTDVTGKINKYF